jgi:hypothetical protein
MQAAVSYQALPAGSMAGQFAFTVELGRGSTCSPEELHRLIVDVNKKAPELKSRHVRFSGPMDPDEPAQFARMLEAFRGSGFSTSLELDGTELPPFAYQSGYRIARVRQDQEWLGYPVEELWFQLTVSDTVPDDPKLPDRVPALWLDNRLVPGSRVFEFLAKSRFYWGLLDPSRLNLSLT